MPMVRATENPRSTSPPRNSSASTVSIVVALVMIVRDRVSLIATSMISAGAFLRIEMKRSRMRSNTTTVSFSE